MSAEELPDSILDCSIGMSGNRNRFCCVSDWIGGDSAGGGGEDGGGDDGGSEGWMLESVCSVSELGLVLLESLRL